VSQSGASPCGLTSRPLRSARFLIAAMSGSLRVKSKIARFSAARASLTVLDSAITPSCCTRVSSVESRWVLKDPTLNDLLGKIANARNRGERPFNEEPFRKLIELPALKAGAPFRDAINKAHHGRADQLTPVDADIRRLVESDEVSFIFSQLGTPSNSATSKYLTAKGVPAIAIVSGSNKFTSLEGLSAYHNRSRQLRHGR
jgi:hypothetical protein